MRSNPRLSRSCAIAALAALPLAACASSRPAPVLKPVQTASAAVAGPLAAEYAVPPVLPHGDVKVSTLGITTLEPRLSQGERTRAVHIRMMVHNQDDATPWQVDTRAQVGSLDGYGMSRAILASTTAGRPPIITIGPTARVTIDLYYPLPHALQDEPAIPRFDVQWIVKTPAAPVESDAMFAGVALEPPPGVYAYGMGQYEWLDPAWSNDTFLQTDPVEPLYESPPPPPKHIGL